MTVTDLAYYILKCQGRAIHFKELMAEIVRIKEWNPENSGRLLAQIHTEINLDSRFQHFGNGEWGLRDWHPRSAKVVRIRPETQAVAPRSKRRLAEDFDIDDEDLDADADEDAEDADEFDNLDDDDEEED